jgi:hypothetical protein
MENGASPTLSHNRIIGPALNDHMSYAVTCDHGNPLIVANDISPCPRTPDEQCSDADCRGVQLVSCDTVVAHNDIDGGECDTQNVGVYAGQA